MDALGWSWKDRAGFRSLIADGDDEVKWLIQELTYGFRALTADINAPLAHHRYRQWIDDTGMGACTEHVKSLACQRTQPALE
jgi:hypothetical protein